MPPDSEIEITENIRRGVLSLPHGWGHDREGTGQTLATRHPGANVNQLNDGSALDPLSGTAVLNGIPVLVEPADTSVRAQFNYQI